MSFNFEDNFWETEFTGVQGFEILLKRLKDGKKMSQDLEDFIKARAKIEETYAKDMQRLARNAHGETELGTLRTSWDSLKYETESCSREHFAVSQRMSSELEKAVKDFKEKQRDARKKIEDLVKKAQGTKKTSYLNENKAKQDYYSKCRAADKAEETVSKSSHLPAKKLDELKSKAKRARAAAETADAVYLEAVRTLEENRDLWEKDMEVGCKQLQDIEQDRIIFLRGIMWKYSNVCSSMAVQEDEMYETVRVSLEKCDEELDIRTFVKQKGTGGERPLPVEYENFYDRSAGPSVSGRHPAASQTNSRPAAAVASTATTPGATNSPVPSKHRLATLRPADSGADSADYMLVK
ncbi:proline-serine-threonine phosphatase-interacting protein 1-like [Sycon ciliatum]|uniref:proline-serine-threonine phosphatase-interacting protein 1-like n=1 Tax=Sycon ciliatum TaxID=27933 RepID=UPI0020ACF838|eukprot:scpid62984/ scgid34709/ Proline-serine-threonine phosphatase-interacting protein 1